MSNIRLFKNIALDCHLFAKHKLELEKQKRAIIRNQEGFKRIQLMNDNVSYQALKEEMNHTDKKPLDFTFRKSVYNVYNYKTYITDPDDKSNPDNQMLFNLFNKLEQKRELKKIELINNKTNNKHQANNSIPTSTITSKLYRSSKNYFHSTCETFPSFNKNNNITQRKPL